jgi:hypothetical protein
LPFAGCRVACLESSIYVFTVPIEPISIAQHLASRPVFAEAVLL